MVNREITLRDLVDVFTSHILVLLLAFALGAGVSYFYNQNFVEPEYSSEAVLYVLRNLEKDEAYDYSNNYGQEREFSVAQYIMDDCVGLIKSRKVICSVIDKMGLDTTYSDFTQQLTIENPLNSRLIIITVTADTPERAKETVDAICVAGKQSIEDYMGKDRVSIYAEGNLNDWQNNRWGTLLFVAFGIIASVIAYAIVLLLDIANGVIRRDDDIERYLGVKVLGRIRKSDLS